MDGHRVKIDNYKSFLKFILAKVLAYFCFIGTPVGIFLLIQIVDAHSMIISSSRLIFGSIDAVFMCIFFYTC